MFRNFNDMLMLNELYQYNTTAHRNKMAEELINYKKFSSEEIKTIIDLSFDEANNPTPKKSEN